MHVKRLLIISLFLAVAAFGLYGLNALINSPIEQAQAAAPTPAPLVSQAGEPKAGIMTLSTSSGGPDNPVTMSVEVRPAPELPTRLPDAAGVLSKRDGDTLTLDSFRVPTGAGGQTITAFGGAVSGSAQAGGVVVSGSAVTGAEGAKPEAGETPLQLQTLRTDGPVQGEGIVTLSAKPGPDGKPVVTFGDGQPATPVSTQVTVTGATQIYRDVTPMPQLTSGGGEQTLQQTLAPATLDDLTENSMVTVWGHKDGDNWIADVVLIHTPPAQPAK